MLDHFLCDTALSRAVAQGLIHSSSYFIIICCMNDVLTEVVSEGLSPAVERTLVKKKLSLQKGLPGCPVVKAPRF